jgi:PAS domain S-box-containing protein
MLLMAASKPELSRDQRILILAPTGQDATLMSRFLGDSGLGAEVCDGPEDLCAKIAEGAGLVFVTGEALTPHALPCLVEAVKAQPTWSDIPIVILTSGGGESPGNADALNMLAEVGNVTLIERPARVMTLISSVKSALRARNRQYDVRDHLTAQMRAKQALEQSEQRLRIALDAAKLGAWQFDLASGRVECTELCKANFGLTPDEELSYERAFQIVHPEDREFVRAAIERAVSEHEPYRAEYRTIWPDQSLHWILASGRANYGLDGKPYKMIGVTLDITERKNAEVERERLLLNAQEANRLKDEFLATVSHELRTPLNAVLGWTHLLRSNNLDKEGRTRALETIERNARSQQQLIEDLLDVSRIITGKLRLDVRPVEPSTFIDGAIEAVRPAAKAKEIHITKISDDTIPFISGDPARLQQVVWNLLSNAIKFTPTGGHVEVKLERVAQQVEITVTDSGQGISAEFLPFVFERFRQADMKTTRAHGGLGLGLAIVRQLVELHGGTVDVRSLGETQGSTFIVRLPFLPVYQQSSEADQSRFSSSHLAQPLECADDLAGVKVLVVDDEIDATDLLCSFLSQCGAIVTSAQSVSEALDLVQRVKPDVLISDIGMPGEDGYELMRKVRALPRAKGGKVPALALTAYARAEDRLSALRAGYQMHIAKPIELTELVAVVASLTERI